MKCMLGAGVALATVLIIPSVVAPQTTVPDLQSTNSTSIAVEIVRIYSEDFILDDGTGQILVEAERCPLHQANLQEGERVTVTGTYGDDNSFNAITIHRRK
ncbi:DNA-binding protein [Phormidium tenue FACHB-886]|nr:DNA-binding protein [Phormidium tenue FACHB-886]